MKTNLDHAKEVGAKVIPAAIAREGEALPLMIFFNDSQLDAFAERIRAAEQERCALLAESLQHAEHCTPVNVAEAIRKGTP